MNSGVRIRSDSMLTCWKTADLRGVPRAVTETRVLLDTNPLIRHRYD